MAEIKAIETLYKGHRFRSRLEARWAVFFDAIGMRYEYEPEGFAMKDGVTYLPDFYLPSEDMYVEVKPDREGATEELKKVERFVEDSKHTVLILSSLPERKEPDFWWYTAVYWHPMRKMALQRRVCFWMDPDELYGWIGTDYYMSCETEGPFSHLIKNGFKDCLSPVNDIDMPYRNEDNEDEIVRLSVYFPEWSDVSKALDAARSARFEHGEKPKCN